MQVKKVVWIISGAIFLLFSFWWVGAAALDAWHGYKWQKQTDAFMEAGRKPYKDDTYGGKTPEETWAMFLDALKKGDVELASKYFVVEKQGGWLVTLKKTQEADKIKIALSNLPSQLGKSDGPNQSEKRYYEYQVKDKSGKLLGKNSIVMTLNPYTKIWKISVL